MRIEIIFLLFVSLIHYSHYQFSGGNAMNKEIEHISWLPGLSQSPVISQSYPRNRLLSNRREKYNKTTRTSQRLDLLDIPYLKFDRLKNIL
jgi:hypothetical protein